MKDRGIRVGGMYAVGDCRVDGWKQIPTSESVFFSKKKSPLRESLALS